jgi:hypothetical protein
MKTLLCWVGRHAWTTRIEHGEKYSVCSVCGKSASGTRKSISLSDATMASSDGDAGWAKRSTSDRP